MRPFPTRGAWKERIVTEQFRGSGSWIRIFSKAHLAINCWERPDNVRWKDLWKDGVKCAVESTSPYFILWFICQNLSQFNFDTLSFFPLWQLCKRKIIWSTFQLDKVQKSWQPFRTFRFSAGAARWLMFISYTAAAVWSCCCPQLLPLLRCPWARYWSCSLMSRQL